MTNTKNICDTDYARLDDVTDFFIGADNSIRKIEKNSLETKIKKTAVKTLDSYGSLLKEVEW